ncbi:sorbosone dehydrogenase family protein [Pontibacter qinzhouensis]|uniref:Sorbosone dehydrogenase family protein n=1 Tax=Pontibacter qinzhouensis TaxID=2603253 RepID=A0A5C8JH06_9BACT|nr:sorbosone dehydrogenase family protein [Pontibacter qinzhouensis]TXK37029.1 sorbosone dehydrogenase family protein [Pontibacter qinzhouensis]
MKIGFTKVAVAGFFALALVACNSEQNNEQQEASTSTTEATVQTPAGLEVNLPAPDTTHEAEKRSDAIGWKDCRTPKAPNGFTVTKFADGLKHPRNIYVAPNNDIFVAESDDEEKSANQITLLRDTNNDGLPDVKETFMSGLNQPYGMLVMHNYFYVGNTDGVNRYPYKPGQLKLTGQGEKIVELPAGGYNHHWTRNLLAKPDNSKIYISVGSASNVGEYGMEEEKRRANILEINPDGTGERVYASGLRNPVGTAWAPGSNVLWTAVNERDYLGDDLVPDYLTSVQPGAFYGWPYAYFGANEDPRLKGKRPDLVQRTVVPEVPLGSHTSSLGLAFYTGSAFPEKFRNGAFIGQHGSWNRSEFSGYKVVFVPFTNGKPSGPTEDFLTGFISDAGNDEVYGRPVGIAVLPDGSLLVADDAANTIWRVSPNK